MISTIVLIQIKAITNLYWWLKTLTKNTKSLNATTKIKKFKQKK